MCLFMKLNFEGEHFLLQRTTINGICIEYLVSGYHPGQFFMSHFQEPNNLLSFL